MRIELVVPSETGVTHWVLRRLPGEGVMAAMARGSSYPRRLSAAYWLLDREASESLSCEIDEYEEGLPEEERRGDIGLFRGLPVDLMPENGQ